MPHFTGKEFFGLAFRFGNAQETMCLEGKGNLSGVDMERTNVIPPVRCDVVPLTASVTWSQVPK